MTVTETENSNIFSSEGKNENTDAPVKDPLTDLLSGITNSEGKPKYDSVEKALQALQHSQEHIKRLEDENKSNAEELEKLRQESANTESVEEIVNRLLTSHSGKQEDARETPSQTEPFNEDAIKALIHNSLQEQNKKAKAEENLRMVESQLAGMYGDKAKDIINSKAGELGFSIDELRTLSETKPQAVLALFGTGQPRTTSPTTTSVNYPTTKPSNLEEPPKPTKSLMQGASLAEQVEHFRAAKAYVNAKLGVVE